MHQVTTYLQLFLELHLGRLVDIRIAKLLAVAIGIILHGLFQRLSYTHVVYYQSTFFLREYTIHTGNSLHQVVPLHGLIDIHRG